VPKMESDGFMRIQKWERVLLLTGMTLLAFWALARVHGSVGSRNAIKHFHADALPSLNTGVPRWADPVFRSEVDFALWNPKRVAAYKDSLSVRTDVPLAILRIPKINLEVPVFNDTDDLTLNRGVGRIKGTAQFGQMGNLGIAGHRDGFFRGLKDIGPDDIVEVIRPGEIDRYVISQLRVVNPNDVSVLAATDAPSLTLVTCFPFYYVGNAPQRYIITARYQASTAPGQDQAKFTFHGNKINNKEKQNEVN
jgi:sortase A